jgi:hypothetical protein
MLHVALLDLRLCLAPVPKVWLDNVQHWATPPSLPMACSHMPCAIVQWKLPALYPSVRAYAATLQGFVSPSESSGSGLGCN